MNLLGQACLALFVLGMLSGLGCSSSVGGGNTLPTSVTTDKLDSFKLGKIFIDTRTASAAFLVLRTYENGTAGDIIQASKLPLGRHDPVTVKLQKPYQLSVGKQQIQITVYLDDNKNGQYDDSDSIADGGALQKVVEINVVNDKLNLSITLLTSTQTDRASEFSAGEYFIPSAQAKGAFLLLYEDKSGKPGELAETVTLKINQKRSILVKLTHPRKLLSGTTTFHMVVHLDSNGNGKLDKSDAIAKVNGEPAEQTIEVELTTTRYENSGTFVDSIHTLLPAEFVVGKFNLATDAKVRHYTVVRLVEDGKPGKTLGVNEWRFEGRDREMKATLKYPLLKEKQKIHIGIYKNTSGKGWKEDNWDSSAELATTRDGDKFEVILDATFESSVEDPDAEFYANTCASREKDDPRVKSKTKFKIDCRCPNNRVKQPTTTLCNGASFEKSSFTAGNGPRFKTLKGHMTSGDIFPEHDEIIFGFDRGPDGTGKARKRFTILALNYKTNTRRFVSGEVQDPANGEFVVGKGELGEEVTFLRRGPDGYAYAYSNADGGWIFKVDVKTGDREIFWKHGDNAYGQCPNGVKPKTDPTWRLGDSKPAPYQLGIEGRGFTIGPDGSIYIGTTANGVPRPGYAVIRISKDAKSCKVISTSGARERNVYHGGIGKGFDIKGPVGSMAWHDGYLYAVTWGGDMLRIDPKTGDRKRIAGSGITGSGSVPVSWRMFFDPNTKLMMFTGILPPNNPGVLGVDLTNGKAWTFLCLNHDPKNKYTSGCMRGPQETLFISYMPGYLLPDGSYLGGVASIGFNHYEISTGNSYIFSY